MLAIDCSFKGRRRTIYAKAEHLNLSGSIKDRMALHILRRAYLRGALKPNEPIIEVSSGNTGIAFAAMGQALGHPVTIFMADWMPYGFTLGTDNFLLDFEALERAITPRTRAIIFNDLHNPTGAVSSREEIEALAELCLKHDLYVLSDEAYWDVRYAGEPLSIASLPGMAERTVILYTFSKKFAMTGWRLGGAIGPKDVIAVIATLNVNQESCTNHFVQYAGVEALTGDQTGAAGILGVLQERRDVAVELLNAIPGVSCYSPQATFYLFPDVTGAMERVGAADYDQFRLAALENTGCSFCTRLHFGRALPGEVRHYVRIAYSGIDIDQISQGLGLLQDWVSESSGIAPSRRPESSLGTEILSR